MAYVSQDLKKSLAPQIKKVLKKYNIKGSIAVRNHSTLVVNLKEGAIDFVQNYIDVDKNKNTSLDRKMSAEQIEYLRKYNCIDVNPYWYQDHFSGAAKNFIGELLSAMNKGNHNNSDIQTDYFDVGWYVDVNIGKWDKPYQVV